MANVSIKFNNKEFLLACEDGQEEHLEELLIQINKKFNNLKNKEKLEERKQIEFSEKIDELNQETDTLLDEIDKWQM